jgi:hypothetical protein
MSGASSTFTGDEKCIGIHRVVGGYVKEEIFDKTKARMGRYRLYLPQGRDKGRAVLKTVMSLRVPQNIENPRLRSAPVCDFTQRTLVVSYSRLGTTYRTVEDGNDRLSRNVR